MAKSPTNRWAFLQVDDKQDQFQGRLR